MNKIYTPARHLARASNGNPVISTATVILFYLMFGVFEASVENMLFGERFEHWLDPIFTIIFMAYAALSVYACAIHNSKTVEEHHFR